MTRNTRLLIFVLIALVWVFAIAMTAIQGWPRLPLDLSAADPATRSALAKAVSMHVTRHIVLALLPPLVMLALAWRWLRG